MGGGAGTIGPDTENSISGRKMKEEKIKFSHMKEAEYKNGNLS